VTTKKSESPALGLALSGGGVRAALFSLGVVIALIETGFHRRLRCLTSVSGGSIVNAALAHGPGVTSFRSLDDFTPLASAIAEKLAGGGVFAFDARTVSAAAWYAFRVIVRTIPTALGAALGAVLGMAPLLDEWKINIDLRSIDLSQVPWRWLAVIAAVSLVTVLLMSRGLFQQLKYDSVLSAIAAVLKSNPGRLFVRDWADASADDGVMHVVVATELLSGEPMYFSKRFVYCRQYGWGSPEKIPTADALYSSAAFPAVFPPKKLKSKLFNFTHGEMSGELPRLLHLADGGVYNNLGIDWFDVIDERNKGKRSLWPLDQLGIHPPTIAKDNIIVVNAGAPSQQLAKLPVFSTVARIMSVLYDNTVKPRLASLTLEQRPVIDISESPKEFAERLSKLKGEEGEIGEIGARAAAFAGKLQGMPERFWDDLKHDTSGTKTKLTSAGNRTGARLMLHGYLSTLVLLHARFNAALPQPPRGDDYFLSLVSSKSASPQSSERSAPAADATAAAEATEGAPDAEV
jgi:predicted acylesterase/phospholipase RssA